MANLLKALSYRDILSEEDLATLQGFKYQGKDDSVLYEHCMSPFCQWVVDNLLPAKLAPNMITLIGLSFVLIPHWLVFYHFGERSTLPRWVYIVAALGTLLYSVSDPHADI